MADPEPGSVHTIIVADISGGRDKNISYSPYIL